MKVNLTKLLERIRAEDRPIGTTGDWGNYDMRDKTSQEKAYAFRLGDEKENRYTESTGPK